MEKLMRVVVFVLLKVVEICFGLLAIVFIPLLFGVPILKMSFKMYFLSPFGTDGLDFAMAWAVGLGIIGFLMGIVSIGNVVFSPWLKYNWNLAGKIVRKLK